MSQRLHLLFTQLIHDLINKTMTLQIMYEFLVDKTDLSQISNTTKEMMDILVLTRSLLNMNPNQEVLKKICVNNNIDCHIATENKTSVLIALGLLTMDLAQICAIALHENKIILEYKKSSRTNTQNGIWQFLHEEYQIRWELEKKRIIFTWGE